MLFGWLIEWHYYLCEPACWVISEFVRIIQLDTNQIVLIYMGLINHIKKLRAGNFTFWYIKSTASEDIIFSFLVPLLFKFD